MAVRLRAEKASVRVPHVAEEDRCPPEARKFCRASPKPEHFCKLPSPASVHSWLWGSPAHGGGAPAGLCQARKRLHVSVSAAGGLRCVFHAWGRGLPAGRIPRNPKRNTSAKTFSKVPQTQLAGFLAPESRA